MTATEWKEVVGQEGNGAACEVASDNQSRSNESQVASSSHATSASLPSSYSSLSVEPGSPDVIVEQVSINVKWKKQPVQGEAYRTPTGEYKSYFCFDDDTLYTPGDSAYLDPQEADQPFCICLIQDFHKNKKDIFTVRVKWFYRPCDVSEAAYNCLVQERCRENEDLNLVTENPLLKSREVFLCDSTDVFSVSMLRGHCRVRRCFDMDLKRGFSLGDDTFFYIYCYIPEARRFALPGKGICSWRSNRAVIPEYRGNVNVAERPEQCEDFEERKWAPGPVKNVDMAVYMQAAASLTALARICKGGFPTNDHKVMKDESTINAMEKLYTCKYDYGKALQTLVACPDPSDMEGKWSIQERKLYLKGLRLHGKNFSRIRRELLPHKKTGDLIYLYYHWRKPSSNAFHHYRQYVLKKMTTRSRSKMASDDNPDLSSVSEEEDDDDRNDPDVLARRGYYCRHCFATSSRDWHHSGKGNKLLCHRCRIQFKRYGSLPVVTTPQQMPPRLVSSSNCLEDSSSTLPTPTSSRSRSIRKRRCAVGLSYADTPDISDDESSAPEGKMPKRRRICVKKNTDDAASYSPTKVKVRSNRIRFNRDADETPSLRNSVVHNRIGVGGNNICGRIQGENVGGNEGCRSPFASAASTFTPHPNHGLQSESLVVSSSHSWNGHPSNFSIGLQSESPVISSSHSWNRHPSNCSITTSTSTSSLRSSLCYSQVDASDNREAMTLSSAMSSSNGVVTAPSFSHPPPSASMSLLAAIEEAFAALVIPLPPFADQSYFAPSVAPCSLPCSLAGDLTTSSCSLPGNPYTKSFGLIEETSNVTHISNLHSDRSILSPHTGDCESSLEQHPSVAVSHTTPKQSVQLSMQSNDPDILPAVSSTTKPNILAGSTITECNILAGFTTTECNISPTGFTTTDPNIASSTTRESNISSPGSTITDPYIFPTCPTTTERNIFPAGPTVAGHNISSIDSTPKEPDVFPTGFTSTEPAISLAGSTIPEPYVLSAGSTTTEPYISPASSTASDPHISSAGSTTTEPAISPPGSTISELNIFPDGSTTASLPRNVNVIVNHSSESFAAGTTLRTPPGHQIYYPGNSSPCSLTVLASIATLSDAFPSLGECATVNSIKNPISSVSPDKGVFAVETTAVGATSVLNVTDPQGCQNRLPQKQPLFTPVSTLPSHFCSPSQPLFTPVSTLSTNSNLGIEVPYHTALAERGHVYPEGRVSTLPNCTSSTELPESNFYPEQRVSSSSNSTSCTELPYTALTENGHVYCEGCNSTGRGLVYPERSNSPLPSKIDDSEGKSLLNVKMSRKANFINAPSLQSSVKLTSTPISSPGDSSRFSTTEVSRLPVSYASIVHSEAATSLSKRNEVSGRSSFHVDMIHPEQRILNSSVSLSVASNGNIDIMSSNSCSDEVLPDIKIKSSSVTCSMNTSLCLQETPQDVKIESSSIPDSMNTSLRRGMPRDLKIENSSILDSINRGLCFDELFRDVKIESSSVPDGMNTSHCFSEVPKDVKIKSSIPSPVLNLNDMYGQRILDVSSTELHCPTSRVDPGYHTGSRSFPSKSNDANQDPDPFDVEMPQNPEDLGSYSPTRHFQGSFRGTDKKLSLPNVCFDSIISNDHCESSVPRTSKDLHSMPSTSQNLPYIGSTITNVLDEGRRNYGFADSYPSKSPVGSHSLRVLRENRKPLQLAIAALQNRSRVNSKCFVAHHSRNSTFYWDWRNKTSISCARTDLMFSPSPRSGFALLLAKRREREIQKRMSEETSQYYQWQAAYSSVNYPPLAMPSYVPPVPGIYPGVYQTGMNYLPRLPPAAIYPAQTLPPESFESFVPRADSSSLEPKSQRRESSRNFVQESVAPRAGSSSQDLKAFCSESSLDVVQESVAPRSVDSVSLETKSQSDECARNIVQESVPSRANSVSLDLKPHHKELSLDVTLGSSKPHHKELSLDVTLGSSASKKNSASLELKSRGKEFAKNVAQESVASRTNSANLEQAYHKGPLNTALESMPPRTNSASLEFAKKVAQESVASRTSSANLEQAYHKGPLNTALESMPPRTNSASLEFESLGKESSRNVAQESINSRSDSTSPYMKDFSRESSLNVSQDSVAPTDSMSLASKSEGRESPWNIVVQEFLDSMESGANSELESKTVEVESKTDKAEGLEPNVAGELFNQEVCNQPFSTLKAKQPTPPPSWLPSSWFPALNTSLSPQSGSQYMQPVYPHPASIPAFQSGILAPGKLCHPLYPPPVFVNPETLVDRAYTPVPFMQTRPDYMYYGHGYPQPLVHPAAFMNGTCEGQLAHVPSVPHWYEHPHNRLATERAHFSPLAPAVNFQPDPNCKW